MSGYNKIKIGIINLGINNLYSIYNIFKKIGYKTSIIKKDMKNYDFIVLPGVGSFKGGMNSLKKNNYVEILNENILEKKKNIIGICLGMQLLFSKSNEYGNTRGLNFINGNVNKFKTNKNFLVPLIGWYKLKSSLKTLNNKHFYHIHSYYCRPENKNLIISKTKYHNFNYCSSVQDKNILGFQFHPEKSGINGTNLLKKLPDFFK
jgi:glutamine amidotransferase